MLEDDLAERVRLLRFHGSRDKRDFFTIGTNSRLDELQAAALRLFLERLDEWNALRRDAAARYAELGLGDLVELPADDGAHVYHLYVVRTPERDRIAAHWPQPEIGSASYYATPLHLQPAFRYLVGVAGSLPETERAGAGEPCAADVGGDGRRDTGASRRHCSRGRLRGSDRVVINRHRLWQPPRTQGLIVAAWYLAFRLRFDQPRIPPYYEDSPLAVAADRRRLPACDLRPLRLLQPLVALRVHAGHVDGRARCLRCLPRLQPRRVLRRPRRADPLAALDRDHGLAAAARVRRRLADACPTILERPSTKGIVARGKEVIVAGAGDAAQVTVKEMLKSQALGTTPIGLVDDDPRKQGLRVHGVRVLGTTADLPRILREQRLDEVLIAMPSGHGRVAPAGGRRRSCGGRAREDAAGAPRADRRRRRSRALVIRPVQVEDVLGREQVEIDLEAVASYLAGRDGARHRRGGSTQSLPPDRPHRLQAADPRRPGRDAPLFEIERELVDRRGFPPGVPVLADVGNRQKMRQIFERYTPRRRVPRRGVQAHVPLMEANPLESVRNNKARHAAAGHTSSVHCWSSSRPTRVNPKTVMGQSKALCEWIVEAHGQRADISTRFVAVRFGNVLGSSGSVILIFRRQIERGGPVTVTHPEMTRFFMTIPEAVSLVVQAGAIGGRGEVFVLDMGEPVKIVDLAHNMIELRRSLDATSRSTSSVLGSARSSTRSSGRPVRR